MSDKRIFTFWEPKENISGYINLCLATWNKFLPDYEIIILDYSNLDKWLGEGYFDKSLYKHFSLAQQADVIRCIILNKYGGIWMDADTVVMSDNIREILDNKSEFSIIGRHIAFLTACQNSFILRSWEKEIHKHIAKVKFVAELRLHKIFKIVRQKYFSWDCLGNAILNPIMDSVKDNKAFFNCMDINELRCRPEIIFIKEKMDIKDKYRAFFFENDYSDEVLKFSDKIILLHNSWTPEKYRKMSEVEFLTQNNTLSQIFKKLGITKTSL